MPPFLIILINIRFFATNFTHKQKGLPLKYFYIYSNWLNKHRQVFFNGWFQGQTLSKVNALNSWLAFLLDACVGQVKFFTKDVTIRIYKSLLVQDKKGYKYKPEKLRTWQAHIFIAINKFFFIILFIYT